MQFYGYTVWHILGGSKEMTYHVISISCIDELREESKVLRPSHCGHVSKSFLRLVIDLNVIEHL